MIHKTTSLLFTLILLCYGLGYTLYGQNKITLTTEKTIGEKIKLEINAVPGASLSYEGLEEDAEGQFTITLRTFSIIGDVDALRFTNCGIKEVSFSPKHSTIREVWGNFNKVTGMIDLSGAPLLETFVVTRNLLSRINLSNCPKLSVIHAERNALESVNIENCNALTFVGLSRNELRSIQFPSEAENLVDIRCENNQINGKQMRQTLQSLPDLNGQSNWGSILLVNQKDPKEQNWAWNSDLTQPKERGYLVNAITESGDILAYHGVDDPVVTHQQISMTIGSDLVNQTKFMSVKGSGDITIEGVKEPYDPSRTSYTFTQQEVTIHGEVTTLTCSLLGLTKLDLSQASALTSLDCSSNELTGLDLSNSPQLQRLICLNNHIEQLSLNKHPELTELNCSNNKLTHLTIQNSPKLTRCDIYLNSLSKETIGTFIEGLSSCDENSHGILIAIETKNKKIPEHNQLTNEIISLARSKNWDIYDWAAGNATLITSMSISDALITLETGLAVGEKIGLEISGSDNVSLTGVAEPYESYYKEYTLTDTQIAIQGDVKVLVCGGQKIKKIDISKAPLLEHLHAYKNELTSFTASGLNNLKRLLLSENQLTQVDISNCEKLEIVSLWGNKLQSIGLHTCPSITYIDCMRNSIGNAAFDKLVEALPTIPSTAETAVLMAIDTKCSPSDNNVCNKGVVTKALDKHWVIKDFRNGEFGAEGTPFSGSDVSIDQISDSQLSIHPNPTADRIYVTGAAAYTPIALYSSDGKILYHGMASDSGYACIDLTALSIGCYILQVGNKYQQIVRR